MTRPGQRSKHKTQRSPQPGGRRPPEKHEEAPAKRVPPFLLPVIPPELELHPVLAALLTTAAFLDVSEQDQVNEQAARQVLERVGFYVQRLSDEEVDDLAGDLEQLAEHAAKAGWSPEAREFVESFLSYCGFALEGEDEELEGEDEELEGEDE